MGLSQPSVNDPADWFTLNETLDGKAVDWMEKVSDEHISPGGASAD